MNLENTGNLISDRIMKSLKVRYWDKKNLEIVNNLAKSELGKFYIKIKSPQFIYNARSNVKVKVADTFGEW